MNLRKRQPEDFPAVARLLAAVDLPADGLDRTEGWVIEESQDILGHVAAELTPEVAVIRSLVVAPRAQGRGLARQLMDLAENMANLVPDRDMAAVQIPAAGENVVVTSQFISGGGLLQHHDPVHFKSWIPVRDLRQENQGETSG